MVKEMNIRFPYQNSISRGGKIEDDTTQQKPEKASLFRKSVASKIILDPNKK